MNQKQNLLFFPLSLILFLAFSWNPAFSQAESSWLKELSSKNIQSHVFNLASPKFQGRNNNTKGNALAREYIIHHLKQNGVQPANGKEFGLPFEFWGSKGTNILGLIPGTDPNLAKEYLLISAHYDHLGIKQNQLFPGANDNGCGVASLLEFSRILAKNRTLVKRSILIAFFDAEEDGLKGSLHYTFYPLFPLSQIACMIDIDLIGRPLLDKFPKQLLVLGTEYSPVLREHALAASLNSAMEVGLLGTDLIGTRCDFTGFWFRRIPFVFVTRGQQSAYHQPYDTADTIDYEGLHQVDRFILSFVMSLAKVEKRPQFGKSKYHLDEVQTFQKLLTGIQAEGKRSAWIEGLLNFTQKRLAKMLARKKITSSDRFWLRSLTAALLLESFQKGLQVDETEKKHHQQQKLQQEIEEELNLFLTKQNQKK